MKGDRCGSARTVAKLLMRTALPDLNKTEFQQNRDDFDRLENGDVAHDLCNGDILNADEFRLKRRFTVLEQQENNFAKILVKLIQRGALRMCTSKPGDEAHEQARLWVTLDNGGICFHGQGLLPDTVGSLSSCAYRSATPAA